MTKYRLNIRPASPKLSEEELQKIRDRNSAEQKQREEASLLQSFLEDQLEEILETSVEVRVLAERVVIYSDEALKLAHLQKFSEIFKTTEIIVDGYEDGVIITIHNPKNLGM